MDGFLDFLHSMLPESWFDNVSRVFGESLTDDVIAQSVQEASDFFNMNVPIEVHEDWTTGVMTGLPFTENDDILVFNREQMHDMGISDKEGFDLVMTHEGCHRALQGIDTGFTSHQEELCCDYMAGVRAGLNGMDSGKMAASLADTIESETHPDGAARVQAIEAGVSFAHEYMQAHNGVPPTFSDCLEHFGHSDIYAQASSSTDGHINLRPEDGEMHAYSQSEIRSHISHAESEMRRAESNMRHNEYIAKSKARMGDPHSFEDYQYTQAKHVYERAQAEYNKWSRMKPDDR